MRDIYATILININLQRCKLVLSDGSEENRMKRFIRITMLFAALVGLFLLWSPRTTFAAMTVDTRLDYKIVNQNSGLVLGISAASREAGANASQWPDDGMPGHLWHFLPAGNGSYKIENMNSGEILGISNGSQTAGAAVVQWADNATNDHIWQFVDAGNGSYKIVNQNSGLVLGISGASRRPGANAIQETDNGAPDQLWKLISSGIPAYVNPDYVTGSITVHDPAMIRTTNGTYYVFSTTITGGRGIEMRSSTDRIHFTDAGNAFATIPSWTNTYNKGSGSLWAPDISYHNGKYWLYYAASSFGSNNSAIGLATSTTAAPGSWIDQGIVYTTSSSSNYNAIDPGLIVDASGKWWLTLGSFWSGIKLRRLDATIHAPPPRIERSNPVERQLGLLKAAFERE